jgi:hypothetical protein
MAIVKPHQEKNIESQLCNISQSTEIDKLPTTGSIDKNTVDLMTCKAIDSSSLVGESMPDAEEDIIVPPAKGYNLDFLDQLDDPNFNPFETKTAIKDNFGTTDVESLPQGETAAELIEKPEEKKKEVKKKPMGKKVSKPAVKKIFKDDKESTNEDGSKSEQSESPKQPTKRDVPKPWLKKKKAVPKEEPVNDVPIEIIGAVAVEDDAPLPPTKAYNLDFLDNLDDPNFNPFATKTNVVDDVNKDSPKKEASPKKQDFLDKLDDPNFNPFATKTKVVDDINKNSPQKEPSPKKQDFADKFDDPNFNPFATKTKVVDDINNDKMEGSNIEMNRQFSPEKVNVQETFSSDIDQNIVESNSHDQKDICEIEDEEHFLEAQTTLTHTPEKQANITLESNENILTAFDSKNSTIEELTVYNEKIVTIPSALDLDRVENNDDDFHDPKILEESVLAAGNLSLAMELAATSGATSEQLVHDDDLPGLTLVEPVPVTASTRKLDSSLTNLASINISGNGYIGFIFLLFDRNK